MLAVLTSCTKENSQGIEVEGQHSFRINTTAPCLETDDAGTKASMKATIRLQWNDGDEISVVNLSTGKTMLGNLTAKVNGDKVSFEGELSGSIKAGNKMAAIYPCQNYSGISNVPDFNLDLSTQTCTNKDDLNFAAYSLFDCKTTGVVEVTSDFVVPVSFNQITLATIDPETKIDYVELTNVGNGISFHVNSSEGKLELTPFVGKVRITPQSKLSEKNGALFAYCALAESPASSRAVTVKALPKIYYATWAESAMSASKFYTSIASDFEAQEYKDFMVSAPSSLEIGYKGGTVTFSVTSNNIEWTASATPSLNIEPSSGEGCENLEVVVTVPQNDETAERSFLVTLAGGSEKNNYLIKQKANPQKEIVAFADINLKKYMLALFDDNEDGEINILEAENVQNVNCSEKNIADLSGLEKCPNLKYLNCSGNYISAIILPDLTKLETIVAYGNPIETLNVNNDTALTKLYLQNVSTNALGGEVFSIDAYDQAETLYLAFAGTDYTTLNLTNSTVLKSYDIAENIQLKKLVASGNHLVTEINIASLTALTDLDLNACGLTALNVDTNLDLVNFDCSSNKIASLNVDNNVNLMNFDCSDNLLSTLRITNNTILEKVDASTNKLENLNVRHNTKLKDFNVASNSAISALALGYNLNLETLNASNTALTDIDLTANLAIKTLNLSGCSAIYIIDLSANKALIDLNVSSTSLATLDISNNTSIVSLNVSNNSSLFTLDVSNNISLVTLNCDDGIHLICGSVIKPISSLTAKWAYVDDVKSVFFVFNDRVKAMSIDEASKTWGYYGYYGTMVGATSHTDGVANTDKIESGSDAAKWCRAKGASWYLPALDELRAICNNKTTLNSTLSKISGTQLGIEKRYYWSSTEINTNRAYNFDFNLGSSTEYNSDKSYSNLVRAVRAL